jgi:enamine deaminase RidA (YjgF/YER057c/UK114 family)
LVFVLRHAESQFSFSLLSSCTLCILQLVAMSRVAARLAELGITLPVPPAPAANYIAWVRTGNLVHIAGQIPKVGDKMEFIGHVGEGGYTVDQAKEAAKVCMINFLANLNAACDGDLDRVKQIAKINVFVHSHPSFTQQPAVANGASDFLVDVFGNAGRHARAAIGVAQLPFGVAVEIDGVVEIDVPAHKSNM